MDPLQILDELSALTSGLVAAPGTSVEDLNELRVILARVIAASPAGGALAADTPALAEHSGIDRIDADTLRALEAAVAASREPGTISTLPEGLRVSRRVLPFRSSAETGSVPISAAGMVAERSFGPFIGSDGRPVIFDIFFPLRQVSVVRQPGTTPFLTIPLRSRVGQSATEYRLPAGSVWMLASIFGAASPVGGYAGVRIKSGVLRLSAAPTVSGDTLRIAAGTRVTLTLTLAPAASSPPATEPGVDSLESAADVPKVVIFEFGPGSALLKEAKDAALTAFGTTVTLTHGTAPVEYDPRMNRILFLFQCEPADYKAVASKSPIFDLRGTAPVHRAGWALAVAVAAPRDLGQASGAGALALALGAGLTAEWKNLEGGPAELGESLLMVETDRLVLVADAARAPGATWRARLWQGNAPVEAVWDHSRHHLRYEAIAGTADIVLTNAALTASLDRPVSVDARPFAIRAARSTTLLAQTASGLRLLAFAEPDSAAAGRRAIALRNALIGVSAPFLFVLSGEIGDDDQLFGGLAVIAFRTGLIMLTLPDPYVTSQRFPERFGRIDTTSLATASQPLLIARISWSAPQEPSLDLDLVFPGQAASSQGPGMAGIVATAPAGPAGDAAPGFAVLTGFAPAAERGEDRDFPDAQKAGIEDAAAIDGLRDIFEEAAGNAASAVALLDVSSHVDHLGISWGPAGRLDHLLGLADILRIEDLTVTTRQRNTRLFLLPQFQWETLRNLPNPNIGFFPDRLVSGDDGGASLFGTNTVRLVPILPDRALEALVEGFADGTDVGASFTLPFGIQAAAQLAPERPGDDAWAGFDIVRPQSADGQFVGAYQLSVTARSSKLGPGVETASLRGAAWQSRNAVDPATGAPTGFSALRGDIANAGVEPFFNNDFGPTEASRRVPVSRVDFAGLGGSAMSEWFNPNAVAQVSQVRFDVFVGRTAYEVVQVASLLYCCGAPVVRTITMERRKEGMVVRSDSGWVATGPGLYAYPLPDPGLPAADAPPGDWSAIETHPGLVRGFYNIRRIRETGRVIRREFAGIEIELLEVRFDCDLDIEGVTRGQIAGTTLVTSIDQTGFVQRLPKGYPLVPAHLAQILDEEGPLGGPIDCEAEIDQSGQAMRLVWADVDAAPPLSPGVPEFAAAARGALALPDDANWSVVRRQAGAEEFEPVDPVVGTPLIRQGRASAPGLSSPFYRFSDPADLLREPGPGVEFAILQSSDAHQFLLPRPRIRQGDQTIETTERALLADAYARATSAGIFPKASTCFRSPTPLRLDVTAAGRFRLGPATTASFQNLPTAERAIVDGDALAIRTRYAGPIRFMLDPADPEIWSVEIDRVTTSMDLGPFEDLMGVVHDFRASNATKARLVNPEQIYAPFLDPVVEIVQFLSDLLGLDSIFDLVAVQGSFKFKATAKYPISGPNDSYIDFGAMKIKGEVSAGFGWSEKDRWFGEVGIALASKVPVVPPIFGDGKVSIKLKGTELTGQQVTIRVIWGVSFGGELGPLKLTAEFNFGIEVIVATGGAWQIGLLVQIVGKADIFIVSVSVKIELLAAIARLPPPTSRVEAIGQAKFAAEVSICWFLTISVEYSIEYREDLNI